MGYSIFNAYSRSLSLTTLFVEVALQRAGEKVYRACRELDPSKCYRIETVHPILTC